MDVGPQPRPLLLAENHDCDFTVGEILLIAHVLISCQQQIESGLLRCCEQIAVSEFAPALLRRGAKAMALEIRTDRHRRCLIEKDPHPLRSVHGVFFETAGGELDYRFDLFAVEAIEPFHNVVDIGSGFQVFKDGGYGHSRTFQNPGAAYFAGMLSTASHWDQSSAGMAEAPFFQDNLFDIWVCYSVVGGV